MWSREVNENGEVERRRADSSPFPWGAFHGDDRGINGPNVPGSIAVGDAGVDIIVSRNNSGDKLRCCRAAGHHHLTAARWVNVSGHGTHNRGRTGRLDVAMLQKRP